VPARPIYCDLAAANRILLLARELDAGGSERQLTETAKALHACGWRVHAGCFHDTGIRARELREAGIPLVRFHVRSFASMSAARGLAEFARYVSQHRIDLTHAFDAPLTIFSTFAGRLSGRRAVLSSQRCYRDLFSSGIQRALRVTDKLVDGVVVNCEAIRRHMTEDEGMAPERVHVCYNGIDTQVFRPASREARAGSMDPGAVVIGTVAVLRPEKGLPTLMEAFARVRRQHANARLLVVGSGPLRQPLEDSARSLGVADSVSFEPATADVAAWLNRIDVFVLPSLSEALSNSLMEAMACGVAPVASSVGGNPELVRDGETGLLFPPGDAEALADRLGSLVADEALRSRFAAAAASFIANGMTVEKAATRMASIYSGFLER
jgi:L-malate glycosyltransferase